MADSEKTLYFLCMRQIQDLALRRVMVLIEILRVLEHSPCRVLNTFDEYEVQCGTQMTEQALRKYKTKQKNPNPWTLRLSR